MKQPINNSGGQYYRLISIIGIITGIIAIHEFIQNRKINKSKRDVTKLDLELKKHEIEQKTGKPAESFLGFDATNLY